MSVATTIYHLRGQSPDTIERALSAIFAREGRAPAPRAEGVFSAVVERVLSPDTEATYRYALLRPRPTGWTPLIELGLRAEGLDIELSRELGGAVVVAIFCISEMVSGYRVVREGAEVDRYVSAPTAFEDAENASEESASEEGALTASEIEALRGRPERFADLLPSGTTPEDFARVVLRPGWWEDRDQTEARAVTGNGEEDEVVDEEDRARCIGLALELWAPDSYPLAGDLEDVPNRVAGPAVALAWQ